MRAEVEMAGGGSTWWYVCGECHGAINYQADALVGAIRHEADKTPDSNLGYGLNHAVVIVRSQPTVDAVPVVRCKDCKWYDERISMCDNCGLPREQTFFCADGKRR